MLQGLAPADSVQVPVQTQSSLPHPQLHFDDRCGYEDAEAVQVQVHQLWRQGVAVQCWSVSQVTGLQQAGPHGCYGVQSCLQVWACLCAWESCGCGQVLLQGLLWNLLQRLLLLSELPVCC